MILKEVIDLIDNGSCHIMLYDQNGAILYNSIWNNYITKQELNRTVTKLTVQDYELKVELQ